jgi:hypothetical protein
MQTTTNTIAVNSFALKREYALNVTWPELIREIESNWDNAKSTEPGIVIVPITPGFVKGEVVTLRGGEALVASFESRPGVNELPRKTVRGHYTLTADPVKAADVILFSKEKLGKDATTTCDWEIVTFRGMGDPDQPQALDSLLYNLFGGSGGTSIAAGKSAEEKLVMIEASWNEWKDKVILALPPADSISVKK